MSNKALRVPLELFSLRSYVFKYIRSRTLSRIYIISAIYENMSED